MNWLPFIIAWLIAPTLVIAAFYLIAALTGIFMLIAVVIGSIILFAKLFSKTACALRASRNPVHLTNKK